MTIDFVDILLIFTCLINLAMGVFVYFHNIKREANLYFFLVTVSLSLWALGIFFAFQSNNIHQANFWFNFIFIGPSFFAPLFLNFSRLFPNDNKTFTFRQNLFLFIPAFIFSVLALTQKISANIVLLGNSQFSFTSNNIHRLFGLFFFVYTAWAFVILAKKYKNASGRMRQQLNYVFFGFFFAFTVGSTTNLTLPLLNIYTFEKLGPLAILIYSFAISYSILRHNLMNIEIVFKRGTIYTILTTALTGLYLTIVFLLGQLLALFFKEPTFVSPGIIFINLLATLMVAFVFQPLKDQIQLLVDHIFFKEQYEYQKTLQKISKDLSSQFQIDKIIELLFDPLKKCLKVKSMFLAIENGKGFKIEAISGFTNKYIHLEISEDHPLVKTLRSVKGIFIRGNEKTLSLEYLGFESGLNPYLFIPLISKENLIGIIGLGEKLSGDLYTEEDFRLLETVGNQTATALENYFLHLKIVEREKEIYQAQKLATIGTLTSAITHEIYNPLTAMKTHVQNLLDSSEDGNGKQSAEVISRQIDKLSSVVKKTLILARQKNPVFKHCDIKELFDDVLTYINIEARKNKVEILCDLDSAPRIYGDEDQLRQVFLNLSLNAIQAMPNGGKLRIKAVGNHIPSSPPRGEDRGEGKIEIVLEDTGCGIPQERIAKIFEPFQTNKEKGTGLGLFVVKKIIESHRGSIAVESPPANRLGDSHWRAGEVNKGTIFKIKLPIKI